VTLQSGDTVVRYGGYTRYSDYVGASGSSTEVLSLPPYTNTNVFQEFLVLKPIPGTESSIVAPWGGSTGGGIQFLLPKPIAELISEGYIKVIQ